MTAEHNHPPRCCCDRITDPDGSRRIISTCDGCPEHGVLASREGITCPQCHQAAGRPHTDYCTLAPGRVWDGAMPAATAVVDTGTMFVDVPLAEATLAAGQCPSCGRDYDQRPHHRCRRPDSHDQPLP